MKDLKGLYSALLIPFDENGEVKEEGLRQVIEHNINVSKIDGLYVNGSSGENFLLNTAQKKQIFKFVKEVVGDRVKLIAFNEIKHYYKTIIDATDNSMILYYIPFLTGVKISLDQFAELLEDEKVIGVKYTAADFYQLERFRKRFPNKLIWSGFDEMLVQAAITGVDGAIGSTYNVNGQRSQEIFRLAKEGKVAEAYELQHEANDVIEKVLELGLYQTLKEILKVKGIDAGYCKQPMKVFDPAKLPEVEKLVKDYNL